MLDPARRPYRHKGEITFFQNKQNLTTIEGLQKMFKELLHSEIKGNHPMIVPTHKSQKNKHAKRKYKLIKHY